jgi:hypothetical protein
MPKQPGDVSKAGRVLLALGAVKSRGRASPDDVLKIVAQRLNVAASDKNLRRNIYRDLKSLAEEGRLGVQYFTPDGSPIEPDSEGSFGNIRVEYFIPEDEGRIPGHRVLTDRGGVFRQSSQRKLSWRMSQLSDAKESRNEIRFVFDTGDHTLLCLGLPMDELPVKLLIARDPGAEVRNRLSKRIQDELGPRHGALYLNKRTISRPDENGKLGHAIIELADSGESIVVHDLGSSSGTYTSALNQESVAKILRLDSNTGAVTLHPEKSGLVQTSTGWQGVRWEKAERAVERPTPVAVLMGNLTIAVLRSN